MAASCDRRAGLEFAQHLFTNDDIARIDADARPRRRQGRRSFG
jgi:hypothetical protein